MSVKVWVPDQREPIAYTDEESDTRRVLVTWKLDDGCLRIYEFEWKVLDQAKRDFEPVGEKCMAVFNTEGWLRVEGNEHGWNF